MFFEIVLPPDDPLLLSRDEVEDPVSAALEAAGLGEVTGAGTDFISGKRVVDLEIDPVIAGLRIVRATLRRIPVPAATVIRRPLPTEMFLGVFDDIIPKGLLAHGPRKRPWKVKPGDVFVIPLPAGMLSYGRVTPQKDLYDFFAICSRVPLSLSDLSRLPTSRLDTLLDLDRERFEIVGNLVDEEFTPLSFRIAHQLLANVQGKDGFLHTGDPVPGRILSMEEIRAIPELGIAGSGWLRQRLMRRFGLDAAGKSERG